MKHRAQGSVMCSVVLLGLIGRVPVARADVNPGDVIKKENMSALGELVSPGVKWCIERGMELKIVPYKKIEWNKEYREATEKYAGQVKLSPDGRSVPCCWTALSEY